MCDKLCVSKLYDDKLCVSNLCDDKLCVRKLCVSKLCVDNVWTRDDGRRRRRRTAGYRTKNKNPTRRCGENHFLTGSHIRVERAWIHVH